MQDQFQRTAMLYGYENVQKLKNRRVAVFGIGGVGGHCAEALCRTGVGSLDLFDGDIVDITNINRQILATHKSIGKTKVDVMRERLLDINPELIVKTVKLFYLPDTADTVDLSVYDYIVDAVDTVTAKLELISRAVAIGIPVISSMGTGNKIDPTALIVADIYETSVCPLARIMRHELRKRGVAALKVVYSKELPVRTGEDNSDSTSSISKDRDRLSIQSRDRQVPASNAFVPPAAGLILASEVVKDLIDDTMINH